jgi:hypothetical protein
MDAEDAAMLKPTKRTQKHAIVAVQDVRVGVGAHA